MTNTKYFTQEDVEHTRQYVLAGTDREKQKLYRLYLYKFIDKQIVVVMDWMKSLGSVQVVQHYDDIRQELHLHILERVLPVVDVKRVQAIQNLLYISAKNKLINILKSMQSKKKIKFDNNDYHIEELELIDEGCISTDEVIQMIDSKIAELKELQVSKTSSASKYLKHLEDYIIMNDYNPSGFKEYVMDMMNIGNSQFLNLSHQLGFKTPAFKSIKEKNKYSD